MRVNPVVRWASKAWYYPLQLFYRRRLGRSVLERVRDRDFLVLPHVFNPVVFGSGRWFADFIATSSALMPSAFGPGRPRALDLGTGSGVLAIFAAARGFDVVAVDRNPDAVRCARLNAALNGVESHVDVREGDFTEPVSEQRFDVVLSNPPFFVGAAATPFELAWQGVDVPARLARGIRSVLKPGGAAYVLWSSEGGSDRLTSAFEQQGLPLAPVHSRHFGVEVLTIHRATAAARP